MKKRLLSLLLACLMAVQLLPGALAAPVQTPAKTPELWTAMPWYDSKDALLADYGLTEAEYRQAAAQMATLYPEGVQMTREEIADWGVSEAEYLKARGFQSLEQAYWCSAAERALSVLSVAKEKQAMGMTVVGGINVQLGGTYLRFPDAVPEARGGRTMVPFRAVAEALGLTVRYQGGQVTAAKGDIALAFRIGGTSLAKTTGGKTIQLAMDAAPYEKGGRTYVPVRFFAEALGLEVGWSEAYQTVILLDRAQMVADADRQFTILNRMLGTQTAAQDPAATYRLAMDFAMKLTMLDSLDGDKTYPVSLRLVAEQRDTQLHMTLKLDAKKLAELLIESMKTDAGYPESAETMALMETVRKAAEKGDFEIILNADAGKIYVKSAMLVEFIKLYSPLLVQNVDGGKVWFLVDGLDLDTMQSTLPDTTWTVQDMTVGALLYESEKARAYDGDALLHFAEDMGKLKDSLAALCGDSAFRTTGTSHTLALNYAYGGAAEAETPAAAFLYEQLGITRLSGTLTANDNGAVTADLSGRQSGS